jgi:hypothetical protein
MAEDEVFACKDSENIVKARMNLINRILQE